MPYPAVWPGQETAQIKVRLPKWMVDALDAVADDPSHRSRAVAEALEAHLGAA